MAQARGATHDMGNGGATNSTGDEGRDYGTDDEGRDTAWAMRGATDSTGNGTHPMRRRRPSTLSGGTMVAGVGS